MIRVFYDTPGQMCNRFWSYIDSIGWAIENKKCVYVLFWDPSLKDFDNLANNPFIKFPFYSKALFKYIDENKYLYLLKRIITCRYSKLIYKRLIHRFIIAQRSYNFHNDHYFYPKQLEKIKQIYIPNKNIVSKINELFSQNKKRGDMIVGVHVRRGDYVNWRDGKYFYSQEEYDAFMSHVETLFPENNIMFYIATNDTTTKKALLRKHNVINEECGTAAEDLYALSQCDLIIGPPSSFSRWASLMGNVPIYLIWDKHHEISRTSFSPMRYLNERIDGLIYE